jgi:hypothetical protein
MASSLVLEHCGRALPWGALQIVDNYHAREHISEIAVKFFPDDQKEKNRWARKRIRKLNAGRINL